MVHHSEISSYLDKLESLCPSGYALAFHIRYATPLYLFQTYSEEWIDIYSQKGLVMVDPTVRWGFENTGTVRWSDLASDDEAEVLKMSATYGLAYGFAYATEEAGSRSVTSFARADREFTDAEIEEVSGIAATLHTLTLDLGSLSPDLAAELRQKSIRVTHPGSAAG